MASERYVQNNFATMAVFGICRYKALNVIKLLSVT